MTWSYDLLDDADRELLRRLSVFTDGFTLEAATVIGGDRSPSTVDVLDSLDRLVDASLITLRRRRRHGPVPNARNRARVSRPASSTSTLATVSASSHATYYSTIAARIAELRFDDHETSVRLGDQELGNLRAAITWAYAQRPPPTRHVDRHAPVDVLLGTGRRK